MVNKGKISEYRERLDTTLASPELSNDDSLRTLIRDQLLRFSDEKAECSENVIQRKTADVSYFLDMLRSASDTEHGEWKLKDDNEECRVMYRPGPRGTPLHTLLAEGYVDGPVDTCLCISWESTLYNKWWPHITFPPFKVISSQCLQRVRIGEHISLIRVKVTWPLSSREAVVHYFLFEYLKDGLVVVLVNSISDSDSIDRSTHGFTRDRIPEAKDVVRIDVVGGFAIQKVTSQRSYFRTIATVDLKLDFVPPSLINFIARQLLGTGFRLFQKAVVKVSNYDEDYSKVLEDQMYARIREALYSTGKPNGTTREKVLENEVCLPVQEHYVEDTKKSFGKIEQNVPTGENASASILENPKVEERKIFGEIEEDESEGNGQVKDEIRGHEQKANDDDRTNDILQNASLATDRKVFGEIEEEESEDSIDLENDGERIGRTLTSRVAPESPVNYRANTPLSPQVERALATLEKAISLVRQRQSDSIVRSSADLACEENPNLQKNVEKGSSFAEDGEVSSDSDVSVEASEKQRITERTSHESSNGDARRAGSNSSAREVNHSKIAPATPEQYLSIAREGNHGLQFSNDGIPETPTEDDKQLIVKVNDIYENNLIEGKKWSRQKNHMKCCFGRSRGQKLP